MEHLIRQQLEKWSDDLSRLRQNRVLGESAFITFVEDRGIPVFGVVEGDPGTFYRRGWLRADGSDHEGKPLFHPFRMYPIHRILQMCELGIALASSLRPEGMLELTECLLTDRNRIEQIEDCVERWNEIVDLALLLEPLYWPHIVGKTVMPGGVSPAFFRQHLIAYRENALQFVRELDPAVWELTHKSLRLEASDLDGNTELYLLLRVANWDKREALTGALSGALWIRQIAELIRRAFEEAHHQRWPEEDQDVQWYPDARKRLLGAERPLDNILLSGPHLAFNFGLLTGSAVRWYVEGETEYFAVLQILVERASVGIELVKTERDNAALKLQDWLAEDRAFRRFSMISFDRDVQQNVKAVRRQMEQGHVVGLITAHDPDFEFANFAVEELVEVAARIDEGDGYSGDAVRRANWTNVSNGRTFEKQYTAVSARRAGRLKGEDWGRALAELAVERPARPDINVERPLWSQIRGAVLARTSHYDFQAEHFRFDPSTFGLVTRPKPQP